MIGAHSGTRTDVPIRAAGLPTLWSPRPRRGWQTPRVPGGDPRLKYARVERERRILLGAAPDLTAALRVLQIWDRYLRGTTLRLREVREAGQPTVYKFGQKVQRGDGTPSEAVLPMRR